MIVRDRWQTRAILPVRTQAPRVLFITGQIARARCGVADYVARLQETLPQFGWRTEVIGATGMRQWGWRQFLQLLHALAAERPDAVWLQWVPFLYHRWGLNPWIPVAALAVRLSGVPLFVMVHEAWLPASKLKWIPLSLLHRASLLLITTCSRRTAASTARYGQWLHRLLPWRTQRPVLLPVGSNIPVVRHSGSDLLALRASLGLTARQYVVGIFSPLGSGKGLDLIKAWCAATPDLGGSVHLVIIGATRTELACRAPQLARQRGVHCLGYQTADRVSAWLQCLDLYLAPYTDGMTARRSSALAAMAHGVPVVTTTGHLFDADLFADSPLVITRYEERAFIAAVNHLLADDEQRAQIGAATRRFHEQHFTWPRIATQMLAMTREGLA